MFETIEFFYILQFYLLSILYSIISLPISVRIFKFNADRGYPLNRTLSLLLISYLTWILSSVFKIPYSSLTIWLVILAFFLVSVFTRAYKKVLDRYSSRWKIILFEEFLFLFAFILMLIYRGSNPRIEGIEKFMDYAIINGLFRGESLPPKDVWFSPFAINYYYFGHFCLTIINKLTQIPSGISYNLNVAYIYALSFVSVFSIGLNLINIEKDKSKVKNLLAIFISFLGALIVTSVGNLDYMYKVLFEKVTDYFYADARSLIEFTINEFPAYSFLISDLHAHILDIPFVLLFVALVMSYSFDAKVKSSKLFFLVTSLSLGALAAVNSWDFFVYLPFFALAVLINNFKKISNAENFIKKVFVPILSVLLISLVFFLPFYLNFQPASGGVGFVSSHFGLAPVIRMFGFFIAITFLYVVNISYRNVFNKSDSFVLVLLFFGLLLIFVPNIVFLKDIYFKLNPPYYLANTIFKLWYQAWIVLGVSSGYILFKGLSSLPKKPWLIPNLVIVTFLFFYVIKYTIVSVRYVVGPTYEYKSIDGTKYLEFGYLSERSLIDWLSKNIVGQPVILEAVGKPYTMDSLISSYTGLPTVVGWNEHELGWRDDWPLISTRMGEVEKIYQSNSIDEIKDLLNKYEIQYIVISKKEREKYGENAGQTLMNFTENVFIDGDVLLQRYER